MARLSVTCLRVGAGISCLLEIDLSNSLGAPQSWTRAARTAAPITIFAVGGRDLGYWGGSTALITPITVSVSDWGYWGGSIERVDPGGVMQTRVKRRTTCFQHTVELIDQRQQGSYGAVCEEDWTEIGSAGVVGG